MNKKNITGFTLIEIMIVVAIVAILASVALPSYTKQVRKGKRVDAKVELQRIAQIQESYFVQNLSYAKDLTTDAGGLGLGDNVSSEQDVYTISMSVTPTGCTGLATSSCSSFTLTATAQGDQQNDTCGNYTLASTGVKGAGGDDKECWR